MNKLIFANLMHRPLRSIISVLAVAIEVIMILSIVAIFMGMLNDQKHRTNGIGADLMLLPSNARLSTAWAARPCRSGSRKCWRKLPHVPSFRRRSRTSRPTAIVEILYGIDYRSFNALKPFIFLAGGTFQGPNDVIIDDVFAETRNPATGKPYGWVTRSDPGPTFRICGDCRAGQGRPQDDSALKPWAQLMGADGKASIFYIKCDNPANDDR